MKFQNLLFRNIFRDGAACGEILCRYLKGKRGVAVGVERAAGIRAGGKIHRLCPDSTAEPFGMVAAAEWWPHCAGNVGRM